MLHFEKTSRINAPVDRVWRFHERSDILNILTPPWQPVQIMRREGGLGVGAASEFRLWIGPIPVQWIAVHTVCEPERLFVDVQETGPMAAWQHQHRFEPHGDQTQLTDVIDYEIPGGSWVEQVLSQWVSDRLSDMFDYRHRVTRQHCEPLGDSFSQTDPAG